MNKSGISRRGLLKGAALAAAAMATPGAISILAGEARAEESISTSPQKTPVIGSQKVVKKAANESAARVYFSPVIDAASLIKLYNLVNEGIYGKVAIKVHTGEKNGPNIIPRDLVKEIGRAACRERVWQLVGL